LEEAVQLVVETLPRPLADIIIIGSTGKVGARAVALETAGRVHGARELAGGAVWSSNSFHSAPLAAHERRGDWREMDEETFGRTFPRYASYARLFERHRGRITPELALEVLRDPYPREAQGEQYRPVGHRTTICREGTGFSLVMQPGQGLIWCSDGKLPAPQARFFGFDQRGWQRRRDLDLGPTGFRAALACAEAYLHGDVDGAWRALAEALAADGETAPLLLMRAALRRAGGGGSEDEEAARADLRRVVERWGDTAAGAVARAWAVGVGEVAPAASSPVPMSLPFPSAIAPRLTFHGVADENHRVQRAVLPQR
jgi:hypothetical protein